MGLWNYLSGYVIIQIKGLGLERFMNAAARENIQIFRAKRERDGSLSARVDLAGFYALHRLPPAVRGHIRILEKRGVPIALMRLRRRRVLLYGWTLALLLLCLASRYLWFVDIEGCSAVAEAQILEMLSQQGIAPGANRRMISLDRVAEAIRGADPRIAWAGVSLRGVILDIRVEEALEIPSLETDTSPADIVAQKDGLISSIVTKNGRQMVNAGAVVRAGDVLISGTLSREGFDTLYVRASGTVKAEVAYVFTATAGPELYDYVRTGEFEDYTAVSLFGRGFSGFSPEFPAYTSELRKRVLLTGNLLPVMYSEYRCFALEKQSRPADDEELGAAALEKAERAILRAVPEDARILSKESCTELLEDGTVRARIVITAEEEIGRSIQIQQE